ncbi:hypothetical protein [Ensifer adhaerens]|uniref:hypothetical protein n=1 Tax=Ensifer adhaerens TaxID=106592 RepID=UPI0011BDADD0|nr:hypothetical protein [Ensifer adhaerens]
MLGAMKNFVKATKLIGRIPKIEQKLDLLLWETPDIPRDFFSKFLESARQMGWLESAKQHKPMTADGEPCPWYTYPMLHFLGTRQLADLRVFEYGSGNSTLWWSRKAKSVVSVEHDRDWFELISKQSPANVTYNYRELVEGGDYSTEVTRPPGHRVRRCCHRRPRSRELCQGDDEPEAEAVRNHLGQQRTREVPGGIRPADQHRLSPPRLRRLRTGERPAMADVRVLHAGQLPQNLSQYDINLARRFVWRKLQLPRGL